MTSAQLMQTTDAPEMCRRSPRRLAALLCLAAGLIGGCESLFKEPPSPGLVAPYGQRQIWAVAPLNNESGVSDVDTARVADLMAQEAQHVTGVDVIPVNRVILAMRQMNLSAVTTASEAMTLMNVLDVDGLIVGTITAWDPYKPPTLGAAVELHLRDRRTYPALDSVGLTRAVAGEPAPAELEAQNPVAQSAGIFDARLQTVQEKLERFSRIRVEDDGPFGQDVYLVRMELYTQFVSYQLIESLLQSERTRLGLVAQESP